MSVALGTRVGPYEILALIGTGGMGEVYKARDTRLDREVALKFLLEAAASDPTRLERFTREAKAASALNHPNIVTIYEINSEGALHYIAMELVHGRTLSDMLRGGKQLPVSVAVTYVKQIADGLGKAHRAGIVHRDIKPSNLMVTDDGVVKILDFGLAKLGAPPGRDSGAHDLHANESPLTEPGIAMGTVQYMSPEQAAGDPGSPRSDVFSIGIVLYEILGGRRPFKGSSQLEIMRALLSEEPPPLRSLAGDIPEDLARITHKCLAKNPQARYRDSSELWGDLRAFDLRLRAGTSHGETTITLPIESYSSSDERKGRRRVGAVALALGLAALIGLIAWRSNRTPASSRAERSAMSNQGDALDRARAYLWRYDIKGNLDRAIDLLEPVSRQDRGNAGIHAALAEAYVRKFTDTQEKDWLQKATPEGRAAVTANDDLSVAHLSLGMALGAVSPNDAASNELQRAIDLNPLSSRAFLAFGRLRFLQNRMEEAEAFYKKAIELDSNDWAPLDGIAAFYYRRARYDEAVDNWTKALRLTPDNVLVMIHLGAGYHGRGQDAEAASEFQSALERDGDDASTWNNLATARYYQGDYRGAATAAEKAVHLVDTKYLYWGNLGDCYRWAPGFRSQADDAYEHAIRLARDTLATNKQDTSALSSLAVYLAKAGETAGALDEAASVEKAGSTDPGINFKIALVYELAHKRKEALAALGRAIKAGYSMHAVEHEPELADLRSAPGYAEIASGSKVK